MVIASYNDLTSFEKIVYVRYLNNGVTEAQLDTLVANGKVRSEAAAFMRTIKGGV